MSIWGATATADVDRWGGDRASDEGSLRERFESALRAADMGTWHWDLRSGAVDWDRPLEDLFGVGPGGFEGTFPAFARRVHPEDRPLVETTLDRVLRSGSRQYAITHRIVLPDGQPRWIQVAGTVVRDPDGRPVEMVGVVLDAEDRRRAETELASVARAAHAAQRALDSAQRRLGMLARLGTMLGGHLSPDAALHQVADLVVQNIADWCVVDLADHDGRARRAVVAHRDPADAVLAARLRAGEPAGRTPGHGRLQPVFVPDVDQGRRAGLAAGPHGREVLDHLRRPASYLALPLVADGRCLGTMTLVTTQGWHLDHDDVELAREVAHRAAAAVETAALRSALQEARRALAADRPDALTG